MQIVKINFKFSNIKMLKAIISANSVVENLGNKIDY